MDIASFGVKLRQAILRLNVFRSTYPEAFLGCSAEEIENVMHEQGVEFLPKIYREFMMEMGKRAGGWLFYDAVYFCPHVGKNKIDAAEILERHNKQLVLPPDAFVFAIHPNDAFHYFLTAEQSEDPPVYYFHYALNDFYKMSNHLSIFFYSMVEQLAAQLGKN